MLRLRAIDSCDSELVDSVYELMNNHPNDALSRMARPRGRSRAQVQDLLREREASDDFYYAIESDTPSTSAFVGLVQGIWIDRVSLTVDIGIVIFRQYQGQGYGKAALALFLDTISKYFNVRKATSSIVASNMASRALFERIGFHVCGSYSKHFLAHGIYHDVILYEILLDSCCD
jgi:RimJ/RimL family protein N-acetyltransferase